MSKILKRILAGTAIAAALAVPTLVGSMSGAVRAQPAPQEDGRVARLLDQLLEILDADKNGSIDKAEVDAAKARPAVEGEAQLVDGRDNARRGPVSKADFMARAEERFARMDSNGDGEISRDEREMRMGRHERRRMHGERRHDHGGRFERAGHHRDGDRADRLFQRFDADSDGMISREEVEAGNKKWQDRRDENRD